MRIALAVDGSRGDVHPMLALATACMARGHEVVVLAPPGFRSAVEERGMEFRVLGIDIHAWARAHAALLTAGGVRSLRAAVPFFRETLDRQFATLPRATGDVDRIIGAGVQLAGASAAELHGIPYRYVVYCPAFFPSSEHAPIVLPTQALPAPVNRAAWRLVLAFYRWTFRGLNRKRAELGLAPVDDVFRHILSDRPLLAADRELAPLPRDCPFDVEQIGCLHPVQGPALPSKLEAFLDQGPAPVYLGFGSMTDPDPAGTTKLMLEAIARVGCRALISEGWAGLGRIPLPEGVMAIEAVSHARLFPRVSAVVHHGGAGTTTTAARAGVPQLVIPHLLDQFYWAARVTRLGLGPPSVARNRLTADRLSASLAEAAENEVLAERARELGERLRAALLADGLAWVPD